MDTIYPIKRKISIPYQVIGLLFFGTLIFFSWHFYKERMLMMDGAFYDFRLIQGGFNAGPARYGDWVGELLPWLAWRMNLSLSVIIMLHSVSLMLFHYAIFLFITLILKNNGAGLAVMLASCLAYARAFYIPMEEINESLVLAVLLWAIIHPEFPYISNKQKNAAAIGAFLTIFFMSFFHPLGIFLIIFALGSEMVLNKRYGDIRLWLILILGIGWFMLKSKVLFVSQYDTSRQVPLSMLISRLPQWNEWKSIRFALSVSYKHFLSLIVLTFICLLLSIRKGLLFFIFCFTFLFLYTVIFLGTFYKGDASWILECYYTVYGFFTGILFTYIFYRPAKRNLALLISLPFLWLGIHRIYDSHTQFTYRLSYLSRIINDARENNMKKCFIDTKCYPADYAEAQWDVAFETLLYSSLPGPDSSVTIFIKEPSFDSLCRVDRDKPNVLFGVYFAPLWFSSNDIPQKYFHLPPGPYGNLTHSQDDSSFRGTQFSSNNLKIIPLQQTIYARKGDRVTILPLKIVNTFGKIIPAIPRDKNPVELSYRMYDKNGNSDTARFPTPFETDVNLEEVSGLIIYLPFQKGTFFIKPDIVTVDSNEWNLPCRLVTLYIN